MLREGNAHSARDWKVLLEPIVVRYHGLNISKFFRVDPVFVSPFQRQPVRLQLFVLAYKCAVRRPNFRRRLALPRSIRHCRYVTFQLAEVAVPRQLFAAIPGWIQQLAPAPT